MSSSEKKLLYLLVENKILSTLSQPLKSGRIKYTCFDVSRNFLILGATSGGLYVFKRDPCIFLQLVPNKEGAVNKIALSWDEKLIAFSTVKGVTCVLELEERNEARLINRSLEHSGSIVSALVWAKHTNQLYVGDNIGRLSVINVSLFMNKNIFHVPAYMFMKLDSGVVQISCFEEYLLISTITRCYICDTTKEKYKQIGSQLREGVYGATFLNSSDGIKIYCARPGSRLWEADISGNVKSTHQFKKALATQSVAIVKLEENIIVHKSQSSWPDQSFNFCTLVGLFDSYLFTFKSDGVYIFDPTTAEVILWSDYYKDIIDAKCVNDIVYLWTSVGKMYSFIITPLNKCLVQLYFLGKYQLCIEVLEKFIDHAKSFSMMSKVTCLIGLKDHLPGINKNSKLSCYIDKLFSFVKERQFSNLDSGIFFVDNKHWKKWKLNVKNKTIKQKKITRSCSLSDLNKLSGKSVNEKKSEHNSTVSLPEIQLCIEESDINTVSGQSICDSYLVWNMSISGSFMQQIPFLSLTSPDLIQSTIIELGQSVKKKLSMSTMSKKLQNKWHFLEEKLKMSKELYNNETLKIENLYFNDNNSTNKSICDLSTTDETIVYHASSSEAKKNHNIDISEICTICEQINHTGVREDLSYFLFDAVIKQMININQVSNDEHIRKSFPFKFVPHKYHEIIKNTFFCSLKWHWILKYLTKFKNLKLNILDTQEHPNILKQIHTLDNLSNDIAFSHIILMFSEIIDPNLILDYIENCKLPCTFLSWSIVLDIFQDNAFSFFAAKKDYPLNYFECPLPYLLNILFLMLRLEQIESSCHMAINANLKLYHISYLIIKLSMHLEFTGIKYINCLDKCNKLFLNCITCLLKNGLILINELSNPEIMYHIEVAFFSVNKPPHPICFCNYPLLGNKKVFTRYSEIGQLLLYVYLIPFRNVSKNYRKCDLFGDKLVLILSRNDNVPVNDKLNKNCIELIPEKFDFSVDFLYPNNKENIDIYMKVVYSRIISLLQTVPDLFISLINCFELNFSGSYLPFIVQFGIIENICKVSCKPLLEYWKDLFTLNLKLSNGECCICYSVSHVNLKVDWNLLSFLALKFLKSSEALKLIVSCSDFIPSDEIDIRFFRVYFLKQLMEENHVDDLSLIDLYYEKLQLKSDNYEKLSSTIPSSAEKIERNSSFEIDVNDDLCCQCSLVLSSNNVTQERKIRIFRCKHVFHILCLQFAKSLFDCPICSKRLT